MGLSAWQYKDLSVRCRSITPVGSRVTCDPPPTGTDEDHLVLIDLEKLIDFIRYLYKEGWSAETAAYGSHMPSFFSFRLGDVNLIVTYDEEFHRRFLAATYVAKALNLLYKYRRVQLFQAVLYGVCWPEDTSNVHEIESFDDLCADLYEQVDDLPDPEEDEGTPHTQGQPNGLHP